MKLLIVGSGGREHAWRGRSAVRTPVRPSTLRRAIQAPLRSRPTSPSRPTISTGLVTAVDAHDIDLTIIGPEVPLALGLADRLRARGRLAVGPSAAAARIESSKAFSKDVMAAAGIPTAASRTFTDLGDALAYVDGHAEPLVVKASGLAAGKGAIVCETRGEAAAAVRAMLGEHQFGDAGKVVVIESFLVGEETSLLAITNGCDIELLPASQDHKRLLEGDRGPNTGGMGAYGPVSIATPELLERARREVIAPCLAELARRGAPFSACSTPADGRLGRHALGGRIQLSPGRPGDAGGAAARTRRADGVARAHRAWRGPVAARHRHGGVRRHDGAGGARLPDTPEKGAAITIPTTLPEGVTVFHAGTKRDADGILRVNGGRVLNVTAVAGSFAEAQSRSRTAAESITFDGKQYRRDIGGARHRGVSTYAIFRR
jgi:phosphoribosylamine--glycine ligase